MVTDEDMIQLDCDYRATIECVRRLNQLKAYVNQYQSWMAQGIKCEKYLKRAAQLLREHELSRP